MELELMFGHEQKSAPENSSFSENVIVPFAT